MQNIHSNQKIEIEQPFKVSAGPGAGKTHWLVTHVKNVLQQSIRLAKTGKVACITYTNTGVEEIQKGLKNSAERIEVSTIHSFLYTAIVKPYAFALKNEDGRYLINLYQLDGHDENIPTKEIIYNWKANTGQVYLSDEKKVYACLKDLDWQFNEDGELVLSPRESWKIRITNKVSIRKDSLLEYKRLYWNRGTIHHEDVLYFAYRLIIEFPEILEFISAKYPYIFIDEFQDTHPIQTAIIKKIAERGTIIGVIGDSVQSIYKFQGAKRQDFINFSLPGIQHYSITGNRRSSAKIIGLLNKIRRDEIEQSCIRGIEGCNVKLLVGDKFRAIEFVNNEAGSAAILTRNNEIVGQIKNYSDGNLSKLWDISRTLDTDGERQNLIYSTIYGIELVLSGNYHEGRKKISRLFKVYIDDSRIPDYKKREYSIELIQELLTKQNEYSEKTVTEYNNSLHNFVKTKFRVKLGAEIRRGNYKDNFADNYTCRKLSQSLKIHDELSLVRTIHKSKGSEFENVLVVIENEQELEYITKSNVEMDNDDSRIYYVALSRAKDRLYITVPDLNASNRKIIEKILNIEIIPI